MNEEIEYVFKAFTIENANGSFYLQLFRTKDDAYKFVEEKYDMAWTAIQKKHKLKIVKVEVIKKKWR